MDLKVFLEHHAHSFEYGLGWFLPDALAKATYTFKSCSGEAQ
jgi:hypothetical protein